MTAATPSTVTEVSATFVERLRKAHPAAVIVDLSGDLRLPTAESYRLWYGHDHPAPALLTGVPYGLTEIYRDRIRGAKLVVFPQSGHRPEIEKREQFTRELERFLG
jgi:N-acetyl-gamma-glutamylphosphate reductase